MDDGSENQKLESNDANSVISLPNRVILDNENGILLTDIEEDDEGDGVELYLVKNTTKSTIR